MYHRVQLIMKPVLAQCWTQKRALEHPVQREFIADFQLFILCRMMKCVCAFGVPTIQQGVCVV